MEKRTCFFFFLSGNKMGEVPISFSMALKNNILGTNR